MCSKGSISPNGGTSSLTLTDETDGTDYGYYTYDAFNRLSSYTNGVTNASYTYGADNLRKSKTVDGVTTNYTWNGSDMVLEEKGTQTNRYYYGADGIAFANFNGTTNYYQKNAHGDITALTNANGTITKNYQFDAFGNELTNNANDTNPFRYAGQYQDNETGLIYLRNRYYDSNNGRFITEDPIKDGLNWYVYVNNNPINFIDPLGLAPTPEEAAAMADHIYDWEKDSERRDRTVAGWRLIDVLHGRESMKMGIYIKDSDDWQNPSEYALVFRGSIIEFDIETVDVWKNNAEQLLSAKSADMWDAINYSVDFTSSHSQEITFVGHSKGGAEALAAAVATGKNAIVFNPAKPNLKDYNLSACNYNGNATSYVVRGEILNNLFGEPGVGQVKYLNQKYKTPWYLVGDARKIANIINPILNHLMEAVFSGI